MVSYIYIQRGKAKRNQSLNRNYLDEHRNKLGSGSPPRQVEIINTMLIWNRHIGLGVEYRIKIKLNGLIYTFLPLDSLTPMSHLAK